MIDTAPLSETEFAINQEPRCPCVLLLDTSGSMSGTPIDSLNDGLRTFKDSLMEDAVAQKRVEIAVVTFESSVNVVQDFITADSFDPPTLRTGGLTHMGEGIIRALDMIRARKKVYNENGIVYYRPWVFMITDGASQGEPDSAVQEARRRIREDEEGKRVAFFAVGVQSADMAKLSQIAAPSRPPVKLNGLNFGKLFLWLSASMSTVSSNSPDAAQTALPPVGWTSV